MEVPSVLGCGGGGRSRGRSSGGKGTLDTEKSLILQTQVAVTLWKHGMKLLKVSTQWKHSESSHIENCLHISIFFCLERVKVGVGGMLSSTILSSISVPVTDSTKGNVAGRYYPIRRLSKFAIVLIPSVFFFFKHFLSYLKVAIIYAYIFI